jgi:hypothetical protein
VVPTKAGDGVASTLQVGATFWSITCCSWGSTSGKSMVPSWPTPNDRTTVSPMMVTM